MKASPRISLALLAVRYLFEHPGETWDVTVTGSLSRR